jgi:hypothetical protein
LQRFVRTARLGEFGKFRYVYAQKTRSGKTHVITTWADTDLDMRAMFPAEGDAAGTDSTVVPRPPHSRRTLCAHAAGMNYGLRMYLSTDRLDSLKSHYEEWRSHNRFSPGKDGQGKSGTTVYLRGDGYQVFLSLTEKDGQTYVTLTEAGSPIANVQITD